MQPDPVDWFKNQVGTHPLVLTSNVIGTRFEVQVQSNMKTGTRLNFFFKSGSGYNSRAQGFRAMELNGLLCVSYLLSVGFPLNAPASKF
jgi:hypothetical protein